MKIALLSDIHGNVPALEKVLDDISRRKISTIWFLGDYIGHGPFPNEAVRKLRAVGARGIYGNYDRKVLEFENNKKRLQKKMPPGKYASLAWTACELNKSSRAYLTALPAELRLEVEGVRFLLVHGSPVDENEVLNAATPLPRLRVLAKQAGKADVVLCGHSHQAFDRVAGKVRFINPGSAGRPFDGETMVSYAILDIAHGQIKVTFRRLAYDVARVVNAMRSAGLPDDQVRSFASGRSVDDLSSGRLDSHPVTAARQLGEACGYEVRHAEQVTKLALQLFDGLTGLHDLGAKERGWLQLAALLHDIGWSRGQDKHHKTSRDLIIKSTLPLPDRAKMLVALVTRYHRGPLPENRHRYYTKLNNKGKQIVDRLGALLRLADGLDRSHRNVVQSVNCNDTGARVVLRLAVRGMALPERRYGQKKGTYSKKSLGKKW